MNDGMEEAQRLTPVRGGGSDGGLYPFLLFLLSLFFFSGCVQFIFAFIPSFNFHINQRG